jgi:hypothetical protein
MTAGGTNVQFMILSNHLTATFAAARLEIDHQGLELPAKWRFFIPEYGAISLKQESGLGPMLALLKRINPSLHGQGTIQNHVKVYFVPDTEG